MAYKIKKKLSALNGETINAEVFSCGAEVISVGDGRSITSPSFRDYREGINPEWTGGIHSWDEACELMSKGYQPTVEKLKSVQCNLGGIQKRTKRVNDVVGGNPNVPLAIMGVPKSMIRTVKKPIKTKVLNVYYDMTANFGVSAEEILAAGQNILGAILELEMQGYRVNLWATQSYHCAKSSDMLVVKIKSANTPLDIKRISFPLTHPGFFRVIGFDWYTRTPGGVYRSGLGHEISRDYTPEQMNKGFEEMFGGKCTVFSAARVIGKDKDHFLKMLKGSSECIQDYL